MMEDNPPHEVGQTMRRLNKRNISLIKWPPYSLDHNPIESVWNFMKDYTQYHYPELGQER